MKIAKGLFTLGAFTFPLGIYLSSYSPVGIFLGIFGGMLVFFCAPSLT